VVYGACHRAGQLGETGFLRPYDDVNGYEDDDDKPVWPTWSLGALVRGRDIFNSTGYIFTYPPVVEESGLSILLKGRRHPL
jgi:hypothetical protein